MSTSAHIDLVAVDLTDHAYISGDKVASISDASLSFNGDLADKNYLGSAGWKLRAFTLKDSSGDVSGHFESGDAPQILMRAAFASGATVYVSWILDSTAAGGSQGWRVPMIVESYDEKLTTGNLVEFSAKFQGNGAPTAI